MENAFYFELVMLTMKSEFIEKKLFGDAVNITKTSALQEFIQLSHLSSKP